MAKIEATGNVGADAELRFTQSGRPVLNFDFCDSKSKKDDQGNWQTEKEQWIRVAVWGDLAEFFSEKIRKGSRVTVWGEMYVRNYERKDGSPGYSLDLNADAVKVWPPKNGQQQSQQQSGGFGGQQSQQAPQQNWGAPPQQSAPPASGWGNTPSEPPF